MKILFGVFDWGLGHATRDIPLIKELCKKNEVYLLSTGLALKILKDYFRDRCFYYDVPSLYPPYTKTAFFRLKFVLSCPWMLKTLRQARKQTEQIITREKFDAVVSDCRYDVYDRPENSYLINHQLRFKTPLGAEWAFELWLASRMKKYRYVFVPDFEEHNLSGHLSHNLRYISEDKIRYIGILSHLSKLDKEQDIDYFVSLSGPEPQRVVLEKKIISQLNQLKGRVVIAGGNPEGQEKKLPGDAEFYSFLKTEQQQDIMSRSKFVITRSGYTTIMELAELDRKKALLMPTPNQTEQEYLADYYEEKRYFHHISQYKLQLDRDIEESKRFEGFTAPWKTEESVRNFIRIINS